MRDWLKEKLAADVRRVRERARIVLSFERGAMNIKKNPNGILPVCAVIGPGVAGGRNLEEVVLLEIGFGKSTPYRVFEPRNGRSTAARAKVATLSEVQYLLAAPYVFAALEEEVRERTARWKSKSGAVAWIRVERSSRSSGFHRKERCIPIPRGIRFTADWRDELFACDLCWSCVNGDQKRQFLGGFARHVYRLCAHYVQRGFRRDARALPYVQTALGEIRAKRMPEMLLHEFLGELKRAFRVNGTNGLHFEPRRELWRTIVCELGGSLDREDNLIHGRGYALASRALSGVLERTGAVRLSVISERRERVSPCAKLGLTFELLPRAQEKHPYRRAAEHLSTSQPQAF